MKFSSTKHRQNLISEGVFQNSNLGKREKEIVSEISQITSFKPQKLLKRSAWWGSKHIGAFHYLGKFKSKRAVLKVQGVKPTTSEIYMIQSFRQQNKSRIIRPPFLYASLPWDNKRQYEAIILEDVGSQKIINIPINEAEVSRYYQLFAEYRQNCRSNPWLIKPNKSISSYTKDNFNKWRKASFKIYPTHPYRQKGDTNLVNKAVSLLIEGYKGINWDFQHAHLSDGDLYQVEKQVVILSNLYWSWRAPLYDAIFAYHWFIYHLADTNLSQKEVEKQRDLWLEKIYQLPQAQSKKNKKLLTLALLERAAAGLNLDALSVDIKKPLAKYLVNSTRNRLKKLISEIKN